MGMQASASNINTGLVLFGTAITRDSEVILQDAGRVAPLAPFTVMAQIAASKKWVPLADVSIEDTGANVARGIYLGDSILAATLVAGDVTGALILIGGFCTIDASKLVYENSYTADTVVSDDSAGADNGVVNVRRIEDDLILRGIFLETCIDIDALEN